jgi:cell division protein FtsX
MRTGILLWSALSGALLGLFAALLLLGVGAIVLALLPGAAQRLLARWSTVAVVLLLVVLPAVGALLGWLEGRLKTR